MGTAPPAPTPPAPAGPPVAATRTAAEPPPAEAVPSPPPPPSPVAATVRSVWTEVLGGDAARDAADFFELGGDSLLATRLVARLHARLGVEVPIAAVLQAPTPAELVDRVAG